MAPDYWPLTSSDQPHLAGYYWHLTICRRLLPAYYCWPLGRLVLAYSGRLILAADCGRLVLAYDWSRTTGSRGLVLLGVCSAHTTRLLLRAAYY